MDIELFKTEVGKLGILVTSEILDKLEKYYNLLILWNEKINLTAITEKKDVYLKHFYDSLTICRVIDLNSINSLCDIGTGAGFPGIVLKIFFPHLHLTLIDSLLKRINFLNEVITELNLDNVWTIHTRAEEYASNNRDRFDLVTARAVSSLNVLLEYSIPIIKTGKYFVAMRGINDFSSGENAIKVLNCSLVKLDEFILPIQKSRRTLMLIKKNQETNLKYPRNNSVIKKHPL